MQKGAAFRLPLKFVKERKGLFVHHHFHCTTLCTYDVFYQVHAVQQTFVADAGEYLAVLVHGIELSYHFTHHVDELYASSFRSSQPGLNGYREGALVGVGEDAELGRSFFYPTVAGQGCARTGRTTRMSDALRLSRTLIATGTLTFYCN